MKNAILVFLGIEDAQSEEYMSRECNM